MSQRRRTTPTRSKSVTLSAAEQDTLREVFGSAMDQMNFNSGAPTFEGLARRIAMRRLRDILTKIGD